MCTGLRNAVSTECGCMHDHGRSATDGLFFELDRGSLLMDAIAIATGSEALVATISASGKL